MIREMPGDRAKKPYLSPRTRNVLIVIGMLGCMGGGVLWGRIADRHNRRALAMLSSDEPSERAAGARHAATEGAWRAIPVVAGMIAAELDADAREAYVYALGKAGNPEHFEIVANLAIEEDVPYIRHAAWLAAARIAPERFKAFASQVPHRAEAWDEIGLAAAWLEIGDTRDVGTLFDYALNGEQGEQRIACTMLQRHVAPLLESIGHWPVDIVVRQNHIWPRETIVLINERCKTIDLQAILDDAHPHAERTAHVQARALKLLRGRTRIARLVIGS